MTWLAVIVPALLLWLAVLTLPWRPWGTAESLDASAGPVEDLADLSVIIPARNEREFIGATLTALARQGLNHRILLVDDCSEDGTAEIARALDLDNLHILSGEPLPPGWSGKLWALEQGWRYADTELIVLLDADIELCPGILGALRNKMKQEHLHLVSLMVYLRMQAFWEKLLAPAFVYFFKLLYPFGLANSPRGVAAAAGGCMLLRSSAIERMGGFASMKDELIDDCTIARRLKSLGMRTWIGLTHSALSVRPYTTLSVFWNMVARTAFHQLHYSFALLLLCTVSMVWAFIGPIVGVLAPGPDAALLSLAAAAMMLTSYLPTLRYYGLSGAWAFALPAVACLFLMMTWTSAGRYLAGQGSAWKGRSYPGRGH